MQTEITPFWVKEIENHLFRYKNTKDERWLQNSYRTLQGAIWGWIRSYINDPIEQDIEDLRQQTLVKMITHIDTFSIENDHSFTSWIKTIAIRLTLNHNRNQRRRQQILPPGWGLDSHANNGNSFEETTADPSVIDLELAHQIQEGAETLLRLIHQLPPKQREIYLHKLYGFTNQEIAKVFKMTDEAVKSSCYRARITISNRLRKLDTYISPEIIAYIRTSVPFTAGFTTSPES